MQNLQRTGPIFSCLWTKVYEILQKRVGSLQFLTPFSGHPQHVLLQMYSRLSCELVKTVPKGQFLGPNFYREGIPNFGRVVANLLTPQHVVTFAMVSSECSWQRRNILKEKKM